MTANLRPRVIDIEPHRAEKTRSEDDTTVTASLVARDMAYGSVAAIFGVLVFALTVAIFLFVPDAPSLGSSPWLSGSVNAIRITALCAVIVAFAVLIHIGIWLPAKALFAASYLWKKAETVVADVALALAIMAVIAVAVVSASPEIVSRFRGAANAIQDAPGRAMPAAPRQSRPVIVAAAPAPSKPDAAPVPAIAQPYRSPYLKFFRHRAERRRLHSKRRR